MTKSNREEAEHLIRHWRASGEAFGDCEYIMHEIKDLLDRKDRERSELPDRKLPSAEIAVTFLLEAAKYFENRDSAHWSNVQNAQNCRLIAGTLMRQEPKVAPTLFKLEDAPLIYVCLYCYETSREGYHGIKHGKDCKNDDMIVSGVPVDKSS